MDGKLIGIHGVELTHAPKTIKAKFSYRLPNGTIEIKPEVIDFPAVFPFHVLFDKTFDESNIDAWKASHNGRWDRAEFLFDKIKEHGGALPVG